MDYLLRYDQELKQRFLEEAGQIYSTGRIALTCLILLAVILAFFWAFVPKPWLDRLLDRLRV